MPVHDGTRVDAGIFHAFISGLLALLRSFFLITVALVAASVLMRARWESRLHVDYCTWILTLPQAPLGAAPDVPTYQQFRKTFDDIPGESTPGLTIRRLLKWDWMLFDFLLYLWGVTLAFGIVYRMVRGKRRDPLLHGALCVGVAVTVAAGICVGLWLLLGGWGPPAPEFFGVLGVVVGLWGAIRTYRRGMTQPSANSVVHPCEGSRQRRG
jgi:hypothetical protein